MEKNKENILFENATAEFKAYEEEMLALSKKELFNTAYQIHAKNEIYGYLVDCATQDLKDEEIDVLLGLGDNVIATLYNYYLSVDYASIMYYSHITEWVQDFCEVMIKK